MSEAIGKQVGLSTTQNEEASYFYRMHQSSMKSVSWMEDAIAKNKIKQEKYDQAQEDGTWENMSLWQQADIASSDEFRQSHMLYNLETTAAAALWRGREHYLSHQAAYAEQARIDAAADGVSIKISEPENPAAVSYGEELYELAAKANPYETEAARLRQFALHQLADTAVRNPGKMRGVAAITMNEIIPKINRANFMASQIYAEAEMKPYDFAELARSALNGTRISNVSTHDE